MFTPETKARGKRFTQVRLREGYSMGEVDAYLDYVTALLTELRGTQPS